MLLEYRAGQPDRDGGSPRPGVRVGVGEARRGAGDGARVEIDASRYKLNGMRTAREILNLPEVQKRVRGSEYQQFTRRFSNLRLINTQKMIGPTRVITR